MSGLEPDRFGKRVGMRLRPVDALGAVGAAAVLAFFAARSRATAGAWEFPLDDAYIYQQFAKNLARGYWFQFQAGGGYTPGSTSVLFPFLLVPGYLAGLTPAGMIVYTWLLEGVLLAACFGLAYRIGEALEGRAAGWLSMALVLATGSFLAGAFSGLEIGLYTAMLLGVCWLVILDSRTAHEPGAPVSKRLWVLSALMGLARPEGILVTGAVVAAALGRRGRRTRVGAWLLWPATVIPYLLQGLYNTLEVGHFTPNTAQLKSVLAFPRQSWSHVVMDVLSHFGRFWKALIMTVNVPQLLPLGILTAFLALGWLALRARAEFRRRDSWAALFLIAAFFSGIAGGCVAVVPGNYYRYYHPTFALTSVLAGVALAAIWRRIRQGASANQRTMVAWGASIVIAGAGAAQLAAWSRLVAKGCSEIRAQQHAMADWVSTHTPASAGILLNDVGAITYYTEHPIFDYLGLVTNHEARVFLEGSGALLERLERIPVQNRPAYLAVFPEWLRLPWIVGPELFRTEVPKPLVSVQYATASIYVADWALLESGEAPLSLPGGVRVVDRVDVADLDSEDAHAYQIEVPPEARGARFTTGVGVITRVDGSVALDGGREVVLRERFKVRLPSCHRIGMTARLDADAPVSVRLKVAGQDRRLDIGSGVHDVDVDLGDLSGCPSPIPVEIVADPSQPYRAYHYWFWTRQSESQNH